MSSFSPSFFGLDHFAGKKKNRSPGLVPGHPLKLSHQRPRKKRKIGPWLAKTAGRPRTGRPSSSPASGLEARRRRRLVARRRAGGRWLAGADSAGFVGKKLFDHGLRQRLATIGVLYRNRWVPLVWMGLNSIYQGHLFFQKAT